MKPFVKHGHRVGLVLVMWLFICFAWYYIQPAERLLHMSFFRLSFLYFSKMNLVGMISAAIQTYIWGYIAVATWFFASKIAGFKK
ncbi:hypothetical protein KAH94_00725 [bacterium]|nr:hypothetical protein [bacterium]